MTALTDDEVFALLTPEEQPYWAMIPPTDEAGLKYEPYGGFLRTIAAERQRANEAERALMDAAEPLPGNLSGYRAVRDAICQVCLIEPTWSWKTVEAVDGLRLRAEAAERARAALWAQFIGIGVVPPDNRIGRGWISPAVGRQALEALRDVMPPLRKVDPQGTSDKVRQAIAALENELAR